MACGAGGKEEPILPPDRDESHGSGPFTARTWDAWCLAGFSMHRGGFKSKGTF